MKARARRRAAAVLAAAGAWACAGLLPGSARLPECPGSWSDPAQLPGGDFALRERLRVTAPDVDLVLDLAIERRGPRLVLVAFDPFGARLFSAVHDGEDLRFDEALGRRLPISPRAVLRDLHAARFAEPEREREVRVERAGCAHRSSFQRLERRALSSDGQKGLP